MTATTPEPEDYTGEDGLLYCGKCRKPKEAYFAPDKAAIFGRDRHPAECDFQRASRDEREAAEKRRRHLDTVEELKRRNVIDSRYRSGKPLIVTTNLTLDDLRNPDDTAQSRIYDRLLSMCVPVRFTGDNFRQETAKRKMESMKKLITD